MAFSNLAKSKILNGQDSHGAGPDTSPMGDGYVFLKYAWSVKISDKDLDSAPPLVAKTCELPRWSTDTQIVNVYNHKTIVQTKLNYEPITMSFYDQVNGSAERLIWDYFKNQFDDTDGSKKPDFTPLTIEISMKDLSGNGLGDKVYTLTNAFITDAQHDTLDYATSDVVLWTITVRYEDLEVSGVKDLEFKGPTPKVKTGIAALPKASGWKRPVTKPPKADALKEIERGGRSSEFAKRDPRRVDLSNWEKAGGGVTDGGAAFGNPNLTKQAAKARASAQKTDATKAWPTGTNEVTYDEMGNVTGQTYSPSTGTTAPAASNTQRQQVAKPIKQSASAQEFIKQEEARIKNEGFSEEYKKAYIERLNSTPVGEGAHAQYSARQHAQKMASYDVQKLPPQTKNTDTGVTNKANLSGKEPSPPPTREGTTVVNQKSNDSKGNAIANRQTALEENVKSAGNVNDANAARQAFNQGKLTPAQQQEYRQTGKVTGIKGAPAYDKNDKSNF